jgi:hypothetical protein
MFHTLRKTLTIAFTMLCIASAIVLAADDTLSGTVQNVDPQQGRITVKAGEDTIVELRAPADLLSGLQTGDAIEVKRSGEQATFIRRREGMPRPELGGALRFQLPGEAPKSP